MQTEFVLVWSTAGIIAFRPGVKGTIVEVGYDISDLDTIYTLNRVRFWVTPQQDLPTPLRVSTVSAQVIQVGAVATLLIPAHDPTATPGGKQSHFTRACDVQIEATTAIFVETSAGLPADQAYVRLRS